MMKTIDERWWIDDAILLHGGTRSRVS